MLLLQIGGSGQRKSLSEEHLQNFRAKGEARLMGQSFPKETRRRKVSVVG